MAGALDPAAFIFEGVWTDWTKGGVAGLTLTLCPTSATFLTNSVALFVTLAGGQLWTILRFTLHQLQTSSQELSTLHNQQQVVLRNAVTDIATARLMWIAAWRSRGRTNKPSSRYMFIIMFAVVHAVIFMIAGAFSNKFITAAGSTTAPSSVLSRSSRCGVWNQAYIDTVSGGLNLTDRDTLALSEQFYAHVDDSTELSRAYARDCYTKKPSYLMSSSCNALQKPRLEWTEHTGSCPFPAGTCHKDSDTIVFDTGLIDSLLDLGINAKPDERMTYQRITNCSVLNDTDRVVGWNGSTDSSTTPSKEIAYAFYGPDILIGNNWTYSYSNFGAFYTESSVQATLPYQVTSLFANLDFAPIPPLQLASADVFLVFLGYTGRYFDEIDDPWFSAHQKHEVDTRSPLASTQYSRDTAISTLSCTEEHQFCTSKGVCTPFSGFDQLSNAERFLSSLTPHQEATFDRIRRAVDTSSMYNVIGAIARSSTPLLANNVTAAATHVLSLHLPDDQWKSEIRAWHDVCMAQLQRTVVQWGTGQISAQPQLGNEQYLLRPQAEKDSWFCNNLMVPSTVYMSFSMFAIILIAVFGTLVIVISLCIENMADSIQRRFFRGPAPLKYWNHDDMLRLQNCTNDDSGRPRPPPKDHDSQSASLPHPRYEDPELGIVPEYPRDHKVPLDISDGARRASSQCLPTEHSTFPCFSRPLYARELKPQIVHNSPEPDRQSWVAISLNSYDAIIPEVQARSILEKGFVGVNTRPLTNMGSSPEIQAVKLHKLPGRQGSWI